MASITIRKLDDPTKARPHARAAHHGRSMEEEARRILREALAPEAPKQEDLAEAIRLPFAPLGGVDPPEIPRDPMRDPPTFP